MRSEMNTRMKKTKGKAKKEMLWDATFNPNLWQFGYVPTFNLNFLES